MLKILVESLETLHITDSLIYVEVRLLKKWNQAFKAVLQFMSLISRCKA